MGIVFGRTGVAEPAYDVLLSRKYPVVKTAYEIRQYGKRYAIETEYQGDDDLGSGFRRLAGYIGVGSQPQNDGGASISMTAPVATSSGGKAIAMTAPVVTNTNDPSSKKMQFILPAEYDDMSKIPKPTNPAVSVKEVPPAVGVIHQFSGWVKENKAKQKVSLLVQQLHDDGLEIPEEEAQQNYALWQYNPPFTIPNLRRNEVWIELTQEQADEQVKKYAKSDNEL